MEYQDPDETVAFFGSYGVVKDYLDMKRGRQLYTTNAYYDFDDDYQTACKKMEKEYYAAQAEAIALHRVSHVTSWTKEEASIRIEGPWREPRCFYMDVVSGECLMHFIPWTT